MNIRLFQIKSITMGTAQMLTSFPVSILKHIQINEIIFFFIYCCDRKLLKEKEVQ